MRVITLGTGAGRPTLQRQASATAVEYEGEVLLFDCGEGTQLQLMRSPLHWGRLNRIFIGHLHGDHLYGLPGLLGTMSLADRSNPLQVYGPSGLKSFLEALIAIRSLWIKFPLEIIEVETSGLLLETDAYQIFTAPLQHTISCWGYAFRERPRPGVFNEEKAKQLAIPPGPLRARLVQGESVQLENGRVISPAELVGPSRPGRSFAYCLDTQPCQSVIDLAQGVDLLIHEATFGGDMQAEATRWGHSTAADAARIARESQSRCLLLTHLSQRYHQDQVLVEEARAVFPETLLASDLQEFPIPTDHPRAKPTL